MIAVRITHKLPDAPLRRSGFTLIELLIASALLATLMAACWSLMSQYSAFLTAGSEEAQGRQLVRSLFDLIETDARRSLQTSATRAAQVAPPVVPVLSSTRGPVVNDQPELPSLRTYFAGSRTTMEVVHLAGRPQAHAPVAEGTPSAPGSTLPAEHRDIDARVTLYHFEPVRIRLATDRALAPGLHRIETTLTDLQLARMASRTSDEATDSLDQTVLELLFQPPDLRDVGFASRVKPQHDHAPEVVGARFEFFDGRGWASEWDSRQTLTAPEAIRVRLQTVTGEQLEELLSSLEADASPPEPRVAGSDWRRIVPREYERTFVLGLAEPAPQEPLLESFDADFTSTGGGLR